MTVITVLLNLNLKRYLLHTAIKSWVPLYQHSIRHNVYYKHMLHQLQRPCSHITKCAIVKQNQDLWNLLHLFRYGLLSGVRWYQVLNGPT